MARTKAGLGSGIQLSDLLSASLLGRVYPPEMVHAVLEDLGIDPARAVDNVAEHGNTSGATVAIALDEARRSGRIGAGSRVLLTSVGAGYTFGAALHTF